MSDEDQTQSARAILDDAIDAYYAATDPSRLATAWVLVANKDAIDPDADHPTVVTRTYKTGQSFAMTRGLLDVALESERAESWSR